MPGACIKPDDLSKVDEIQIKNVSVVASLQE
jgi:hypothetical protein